MEDRAVKMLFRRVGKLQFNKMADDVRAHWPSVVWWERGLIRNCYENKCIKPVTVYLFSNSFHCLNLTRIFSVEFTIFFNILITRFKCFAMDIFSNEGRWIHTLNTTAVLNVAVDPIINGRSCLFEENQLTIWITLTNEQEEPSCQFHCNVKCTQI